MERFDDLGMSFPLFQAPIEYASLDRDGTCAVCGAAASFLFAKACYACFRARHKRLNPSLDPLLRLIPLLPALR